MSDEPRVIQVIESRVHRGCGVTNCRATSYNRAHVHEPHRIVTTYHTLDGVLLAESDPCSSSLPVMGEKG